MTAKEDKVNQLARDIESSSRQRPLICNLETSERVLKRITDGIYRQPSSAIRELISNAYDADATKVIIETDCPRFKKITIRDNGNGITEKALASLICNIGGSPKRTYEGSEMGVSQKENPDLSPGGRRLIGKIGIGLFAVAQLTKEFQIITKTKGSDHRTIAHVMLHTHSEEELKKKTDKEYKTGETKIWNENATDIKSHGTEIILLHLFPKTIEELASNHRWIQSQSDNYLIDKDDQPLQPPKFHIGCVLKADKDKIHVKPNYPWKNADSPKKKFKMLLQAVRDETEVTSNPKLEELLDNYLRLLWTMGLEVPIPYIDGHPFMLKGRDEVLTYKIGNGSKNQAQKIKLNSDETLANNMKLQTVKIEKEAGKFDVFIDGVQLFRPIAFKKISPTDHAIKTPLIFVGKDKPNLNNIPKDLRGGSLQFEAYLFWQPKVVPVEHRGVLIRINNMSGTLFDETFMKYPISEQTRKNQIIAEIFVHDGMDAALNIDRESFNYSHPHYQYLTKWLHNSFRQFATAHKKLGREIREANLLMAAVITSSKFDQFISKELIKIKPDIALEPIKIEIIEEPLIDISSQRKKGKLVYKAKDILPSSKSRKTTNKTIVEDIFLEKKVKSIAEVLTAYGLFDNMPYGKQEALLKTIAEIITFEE